MPYDEGLAQLLREKLSTKKEITEKKMFGGIAFMKNGNMMVGLNNQDLMVRVGKENYEDALTKKHAREMNFTGKPLKGFIYVSPDVFQSDKELEQWIEMSELFVNELPKK